MLYKDWLIKYLNLRVIMRLSIQCYSVHLCLCMYVCSSVVIQWRCQLEKSGGPNYYFSLLGNRKMSKYNNFTIHGRYGTPISTALRISRSGLNISGGGRGLSHSPVRGDATVVNNEEFTNLFKFIWGSWVNREQNVSIW